jgi:hypothetical protein
LVREMSTTFKDFFLDDLKPEMNWGAGYGGAG